jgi:hypothetical protein
MPNKNEQVTSPADFFSGGGDLFKNLAEEEKRKKLAAANAAPQPPGTEKPGLPSARPSAPLSPVKDIAGVGIASSNEGKARPSTQLTPVRQIVGDSERKGGSVDYRPNNDQSEEAKKMRMKNLSESLAKLKLPSEPSSGPGFLDKAANFISEVYEDQWAKPSREYKKTMAEIQAVRDRKERGK